MIDLWVLLDGTDTIQSIHWENFLLEKLHAKDWQKYIGQTFPHISEIKINEDIKNIKWQKKYFTYVDLKVDNKTRYLLLKEQDQTESLYKFALDKIQHGVQIYDRNASTIFMNHASKDISGIPQYLDITGKHLLDLYAVEEEISTVMTTLRTGAPVINRFDSFKSTEGNSIVSVNSGHPVFENNELIGAIVFEQDLSGISTEIEKLEQLKSNLKKKTSKRVTKFSGYQFSDIIGSNQELLVSVTLAKKIAPQDCNVLIVGETGTGKEIFAQSIHKGSDRKKSKFVAVNCAAIPETLIESVFFGTSKGSFTGSVDKTGLLEEANEGTLFLDELNSMSLSMQSKLLRVIQEGSFRRVGSNIDIQTDIRFISSCNEDPVKLVEDNILRRDLFYRLSTISIDIPPLRHRLDDIPELVQFYLTKNINRYAKTIYEVSPQILSLFQEYHWPGNIRELFNVMDYILNTTEEDRIEVKHLPKHLQSIQLNHENSAIDSINTSQAIEPTTIKYDSKEINLNDILTNIEKTTIEQALIHCRYNVTKAAERLGLSRQNLQYRIRKLQIASRTTP